MPWLVFLNCFRSGHQHDRFYAHHELIRMIPRLLGPQLSRLGKFPHALPAEVPVLVALIEEHHRTARVVMRKAPTVQVAGAGPSMVVHVCCVLCVQCTHIIFGGWAGAVGHVGMSAEQLIQNVKAFSVALVEVLPSWDRVASIALHATRGPPFTVISAPPPRR
jgi:ribosomal protein L1